jgi:hypothetical protein
MAFYLPLIVFLIATHAAFAQVDPCMSEIQKTDVLYELCVKFDKQSTGYVDCIKLYMEQRIRTNEVCNIYKIPPAPWELYRLEPPENSCLVPEQEAPPAPASDAEEEPEEESGEEKGVRFGIRAAFNINDFSFGYKDLNRNIGMGYGFGGGLVLNVPIVSILRFNLEADLYYRLLFDGHYGDVDEAVVSVPVLLQIGKSLYFTTGVQLDFPTSLTKKGNVDFMDNRVSMDVGIVAGLSYMSANFGLDFRYVYGLTSLFKNFTYNNIYYKSNSSLGQYGFGVSYFF